MATVMQTDAARPARAGLPTMYDLPYEESVRPGMPDEFHPYQTRLLGETFRPPAFLPDDYFAAMEMNLYYDLQHPLWYKRPDWFGVVGVPRWYGGRDLRYSYVVWDEGKPPLIIVELLSPGTEDEDLGQTTPTADGTPPKWAVYEQILRVPYYAVFGRDSAEMRIFRLTRRRYREVQGHGGRFWLPEAGLGLGQWQGSYDGHERLWLRWYDAAGEWIPTVEERAAQEREQKEAALWLVAQERQRADRLAELLRQLGQDPDQV